MSNMQDVPLAEQESVPSAGTDSAKPKSNTLKRLLKLGKKPTGNPDGADNTENSVEDIADSEIDVKKSTTISRFLTRLKGSSKQDADEPSTSSSFGVDADGKPLPNSKPTLKSSLSNYWRNIFKRHQAANKNQNAAVQEQNEADELEDEQELKTAHHISEAGSASQVAIPKRTEEHNPIPEVIEEVQMLALSDDVELSDQMAERNN
ncbi:uncharacterized protein LOC115624170 [Scaptodrosophila lebanonensis]|uniref:Uncharacterized protein LOC115624170 n=1 Tax=Drosophila lebanonensis TaxID=7225 RepID=A0A6J2THY3_DROLE|nr:uncharacterized protein LOC115624170 [Scaptodrosophila lebanonensis]